MCLPERRREADKSNLQHKPKVNHNISRAGCFSASLTFHLLPALCFTCSGEAPSPPLRQKPSFCKHQWYVKCCWVSLTGVCVDRLIWAWGGGWVVHSVQVTALYWVGSTCCKRFQICNFLLVAWDLWTGVNEPTTHSQNNDRVRLLHLTDPLINYKSQHTAWKYDWLTGMWLDVMIQLWPQWSALLF